MEIVRGESSQEIEPVESLEMKLAKSLQDYVSSSFEIPDTTGWEYEGEIEGVEELRTSLFGLSHVVDDKGAFDATIDTIGSLTSALEETGIIGRNFVKDKLVTFQTLTEKYNGEGVDILLDVIGYSHDIEVLEFIIRSLPSAIRKARQPDLLFDIVDNLLVNLPQSGPYVMDSIISALYDEDEEVSKNGSIVLAGAINTFYYPEGPRLKNFDASELSEELKKLPEGRDYFSEELLITWMLGSASDKVGVRAQAWYQFDALVELIKVDPKIPGYLLAEFGIQRIGRYPVESLIDQYGSRDDLETPYGLIVSTHHDWNGGYSFSQRRDFFMRQHKKIKDLNMGLRYVEMGSMFELVTRINHTRHKYGEAKFGMMQMHANPSEMSVNDATGEYIDIKGAGKFAALQKAFVPGSHIVFHSCKVGVGGSFAEQFARTGLVTHGSVENSPVVEIDYMIGDKGLKLIPQFHKSDILRTYYPQGEECSDIDTA